LTYDRAQRAAGAVAGYRHTLRVASELARMIDRPAKCREAVVHRGWKFVLGRQSIVDAYDNGVGVLAVEARDGVVCVEIAQRPSAAVVVQHDGQRLTARFRSVETDPELAGGSGNLSIDDLMDIGERSTELSRQTVHGRTSVSDRQLPERRASERGQQVHEFFRCGVERHSHPHVGLRPTPRLGRSRGPYAPLRSLAGALLRAYPLAPSAALTRSGVNGT
jgi:hypothetical protein